MASDTDPGEFGMPGIGKASLIIAEAHEATFGPGALINIDVKGDLVINLGKVEVATVEAQRILDAIPTWLGRFLFKNRKYAKVQQIDLGAKGIMPDINRKTMVLMDRIWYGSGEVDESTVEVIDDLLGHLMLLRDKVERGVIE